MAEGSRDSGRTWERGWEGHERAQLLRMSRLSFAEKIQWLEEAQQFVEELKEVSEIQARPLRVKADT
ncbi:MAG: hypothetical protein JRJ60_23385 [Deltaproteobacteria bacterium]|nr:hypothetical protein [Deltaproteobacteria bacterium]